jgi:hypothetical protein
MFLVQDTSTKYFNLYQGALAREGGLAFYFLILPCDIHIHTLLSWLDGLFYSSGSSTFHCSWEVIPRPVTPKLGKGDTGES